MEEMQRQSIPPYVSWSTFLTFIARLRETVVPLRIDSGVMPTFSGAAKSQILVALKFLKLIEPNGYTTELLRELVPSYQTDNWKALLGKIITQAYVPVIQDLDIKSATLAQLEEKFREAGGVTGSTVNKCTRFYLGALKEADIAFSPYFVARRSRASGNGKGETANGRTRRGARKVTKDQSSSESGQPDSSREDYSRSTIPQPPGTTTLQVPIPGKAMATIVFPDMLDEDEWNMIDQYFRNYIKLRDKAENAQTQLQE